MYFWLFAPGKLLKVKLLEQWEYMFLRNWIHILPHCFPERLHQGYLSQQEMMRPGCAGSLYLIFLFCLCWQGSVGLSSPCHTSKASAIGAVQVRRAYISSCLILLSLSPTSKRKESSKCWCNLSLAFYESSFCPYLWRKPIVEKLLKERKKKG